VVFSDDQEEDDIPMRRPNSRSRNVISDSDDETKPVAKSPKGRLSSDDEEGSNESHPKIYKPSPSRKRAVIVDSDEEEIVGRRRKF